MANHAKSKEIQVQKAAQSLQAFQRKLQVPDGHSKGLKVLLIASGSAAVLALGAFGIHAWRASAIEKHEAALGSLLLEVQGEGPGDPAAQEKRMRTLLPRLEELARKAPGARRAGTEQLLATWRLELDGKAAAASQGSDPWSVLRLAQKRIALGQGQEAVAALAPLRGKAEADQAWAAPYWSTLLDARRLTGERAEAWKDYAEYRARFRDRADRDLEQVLQGI